ncbi:HNH endonuclease [Reichenbachiella sp.]
MIPDFSKNTKDIIAKRAGFICSNPDCRVRTIGPNTDAEKSTTIGEAAHIFGARFNSKRFKKQMNDSARAEVTNAIWLCRNCHKLIDTDDQRFSTTLLFKWREIHESYVLSELGNKTDEIQDKELRALLSKFADYPPIVRRIITDRPEFWEYRFTAELQRFLNEPGLRRIRDLKDGLYLKSQQHISEEEAYDWIYNRIAELSNITEPMVNLMDKLSKSWGEPGVAGEIDEIHHICLLIRDYIEQIVVFEEKITFANLPDSYKKLQDLLSNLIGSQVLKFESIPQRLDDIISSFKGSSNTNNESEVVKETITFELPDSWVEEVLDELKKVSSL